MSNGTVGAPVEKRRSAGAPHSSGRKVPSVPWRLGLRIKVCSWMLQFVAKYGRELLINFVMERASEMAVGVTMATMDREGLMHCHRCPQRFGLRKVGNNKYACLNHTQEVKAAIA